MPCTNYVVFAGLLWYEVINTLEGSTKCRHKYAKISASVEKKLNLVNEIMAGIFNF